MPEVDQAMSREALNKKIVLTSILLCTAIGAYDLPAFSWASRTASGMINTNELLSPEQKRNMTRPVTDELRNTPKPIFKRL